MRIVHRDGMFTNASRLFWEGSRNPLRCRNGSGTTRILAIWFAGLATVFSFNIWADIRPLGMFATFADKTIFDLLDYLVSNLLMPLGGIVVCVLAAWLLPAATARMQTGIAGEKTFKAWKWLVRYFAPLIIALVFLVNLV